MPDLEITHFHDEPFVIDNAPLGIDIGEKHGEEVREAFAGKSADWKRKSSDLNHILIMKKTVDAVESFFHAKLNRKIDLIFDLLDGEKRGKLTLSWKDELFIRPEVNFRTDSFVLTRQGRRLFQTDSNFRISTISGGGLPKPLELLKKPGPYETVFVVFYRS